MPDIDSWRPKAEDLTLLPIGFAADEGLSSFPVVDCRADVRFEERWCGDWVAILIGDDPIAIGSGDED